MPITRNLQVCLFLTRIGLLVGFTTSSHVFSCHLPFWSVPGKLIPRTSQSNFQKVVDNWGLRSNFLNSSIDSDRFPALFPPSLLLRWALLLLDIVFGVLPFSRTTLSILISNKSRK